MGTDSSHFTAVVFCYRPSANTFSNSTIDSRIMVATADVADEDEHQVSCCCARMREDFTTHVTAIFYLVLSVICLHPFGFSVALCVLFAKDSGSPLPFRASHHHNS